MLALDALSVHNDCHPYNWGKMIDKAKEWLGFNLAVIAPETAQAKFLLSYQGLLIGTLSVKQGVWKFAYSDEFRRSNKLRPLVEFPDVNRAYENRELWQFFASRIPSSEQQEVKAILQRENIAKDDAVSLLRRFGQRTIANPFQLEYAD